MQIRLGIVSVCSFNVSCQACGGHFLQLIDLKVNFRDFMHLQGQFVPPKLHFWCQTASPGPDHWRLLCYWYPDLTGYLHITVVTWLQTCFQLQIWMKGSQWTLSTNERCWRTHQDAQVPTLLSPFFWRKDQQRILFQLVNAWGMRRCCLNALHETTEMRHCVSFLQQGVSTKPARCRQWPPVPVNN